jgi:hypothetical protein
MDASSSLRGFVDYLFALRYLFIYAFVHVLIFT